MKREFVDASIWITGGGSGLGEALAIDLARRGARLALSGRRADKLEGAVEKILRGGGQAVAIPCDVTDDEAVREAVARVVAEYGRLDVAIANAGVGVAGKFERLKDEEWRRQFDINVIGLVSTARHALPELRKTKGRLVLMSSVASWFAGKGTIAYCSSKFAVRAIGRGLQHELHGSGVTCTTIYPGFVESEISYVDNAGVFHPDRPDPRPQKLIWPADKAAKVMSDAIAKRKNHFIYTGHGKIGAFLGQHFPGLVSFIISRWG